MIVIDDIIISDAVWQNEFVCNLTKCKGICCVKGEGGAPLTDEECKTLDIIYDDIKSFLETQSLEEIKTKGLYLWDELNSEFVTPLRTDTNACIFARIEDDNVAYCAIERAFQAGKSNFQKPISCHLYPIRIKKLKSGHTAINYEIWDICADACDLGKSMKVPVFVFLKEALTRKFGIDFYKALEQAVNHSKASTKRQ